MQISHNHPALTEENRNQLLAQLYGVCVAALRQGDGYGVHRSPPLAGNMRGR